MLIRWLSLNVCGASVPPDKIYIRSHSRWVAMGIRKKALHFACHTPRSAAGVWACSVIQSFVLRVCSSLNRQYGASLAPSIGRSCVARFRVLLLLLVLKVGSLLLLSLVAGPPPVGGDSAMVNIAGLARSSVDSPCR